MSAAVTDEDDWLPLPPEAQCAHPGELAALGKREAAVVPAAPAPVAPRQAPAPSVPKAGEPTERAGAPKALPQPEPPEDPAALQALAALRAKLHAAPAPQSFVAAMQQRERREERRRHGRRRKAADPASPSNDRPLPAFTEPAFVEPASPGPSPQATPALHTASDAAPLDHDPREDCDWFRTLPEAEQRRLHEVWEQKRQHGQKSGLDQQRLGRQRFVAAQFVFLATLLLGTGVHWHATVGAGIVCGIWWKHSSADRFLDPLRAFGCQVVLQGLAMAVAGDPSPTLFLDAPLLVAFAALVGFDGEMRRTGGFDVS